VARELVVYMKRQGGQEQFSEPLRFQLAARDRLRDLADYVTAHLGRDLSVPVLAEQLGLSPRQLSRLCQRELGHAPAALVQRLRLDDATPAARAGRQRRLGEQRRRLRQRRRVSACFRAALRPQSERLPPALSCAARQAQRGRVTTPTQAAM